MANLLNKGVMPMVHSFISRCSKHVWIRNIIANGCIRNASFAGDRPYEHKK
ncbi:hypothetical protein P0E87_07325 [Enterococcus faecalis]|nr:hypothetical protein [Enterococcus faecalis]MDN3189607.1 hypothetical protein [Enterococcus faecalis]MDT2113319.1 hypothetical protein [Enterococcus faecalis]